MHVWRYKQPLALLKWNSSIGENSWSKDFYDTFYDYVCINSEKMHFFLSFLIYKRSYSIKNVSDYEARTFQGRLEWEVRQWAWMSAWGKEKALLDVLWCCSPTGLFEVPFGVPSGMLATTRRCRLQKSGCCHITQRISHNRDAYKRCMSVICIHQVIIAKVKCVIAC